MGPIRLASVPLDVKQDDRSLLVSMVAATLKAQPIDPDIIIMTIYILYKHNNNFKKKSKKETKMANFGDQARFGEYMDRQFSSLNEVYL